MQTAPILSGYFSANVWEHLVLQLSQRYPLILDASVVLGSLYYFRSSGPGCLAMSKTAKAHYNLALASYGNAIAGLRSYIEQSTEKADEEVTLVVLVSCLLFVCFEMLQGDQKLVISHLVKGMRILFAQYKPTTCISATARPVILGNDFPDTMDSLVDVFIRLDSNSTMFAHRTTYLCTTCRCCCQGTDIKINHSFSSVKEARSHLDLLMSNTFRLRGSILKETERMISSGPSEGIDVFIETSREEDWARKYCNIYAMSRAMDLSARKAGSALATKQSQLITAFNAWEAGLAGLAEQHDDLAVILLRIQHFFSWFVVSTLRDSDEVACDRFRAEYANVVTLASE